MKRTMKNLLLISLAFGLYQMLISLFFGSLDFVKTTLHPILYLLIIFLTLAVTEGSYLFFLLKGDKAKGINKILFVSSFLVSSILGGSITWFVSTDLNYYFIYVASFLIASFLPTVLFLLYFVFKEAEEKIASMGKVSLKTDAALQQESEKIFHLENDHGKLLLEVPIGRIICYEANDNYVVTYYLDKKEQVKKSMERVSLKKIEELLAKENVIFYRVHKSYLINPDFLEEIKGKAQAYKLQMRHFETIIPVSRSYDISQLGSRSF